MTGTFERRRDALCAAIVPAPGRGLAAFDVLELRAFWVRFADVAPIHLRLGFRAAVTILGGVLPRVFGFRGALETLDPAKREAYVTQLERNRPISSLVRPLLEVAKVVACLAYFSDPSVEATVRGRAA